MLGPKNVDLQTYFFTALTFLSENIKLSLISYNKIIVCLEGNSTWLQTVAYSK